MGEKSQKKSSKSSGDKKHKGSKKRPLWDKGVGYTRSIMTLRVANASYRNGWFDGDGVHSYPRRNLIAHEHYQARLDNLEQELRKIKLYVPLAATVQISTTALDIIERFDKALVEQTLAQTLDQLEGELRGAGMLSMGDDWTFDDSTGRWYRWDEGINGYVYDNGDKNIYNADGSTTWIPADGVVDEDGGAEEESYELGGADAYYDQQGHGAVGGVADAAPTAKNDAEHVEYVADPVVGGHAAVTA